MHVVASSKKHTPSTWEKNQVSLPVVTRSVAGLFLCDEGAPTILQTYAIAPIRQIEFTQLSVWCIRMLIGAVKTRTLMVPMAGPRNAPNTVRDHQAWRLV